MAPCAAAVPAILNSGVIARVPSGANRYRVPLFQFSLHKVLTSLDGEPSEN
jgi:hypothetical protein